MRSARRRTSVSNPASDWPRNVHPASGAVMELLYNASEKGDISCEDRRRSFQTQGIEHLRAVCNWCGHRTGVLPRLNHIQWLGTGTLNADQLHSPLCSPTALVVPRVVLKLPLFVFGASSLDARNRNLWRFMTCVLRSVHPVVQGTCFA